MHDDSLIQAMPDLVAFVRRDGTIVKYLGGRDIPALHESGTLEGRRLDEIWPDPIGSLMLRMVQRALTNRGGVDAQFADGEKTYEARVTAQGRNRVLLLVRPALAIHNDHDGRASASGTSPTGVERRAFFTRLKQAVADAQLRERPLAIGMIFIEGLADIGRVIDYSISEQLSELLVKRLPEQPASEASSAPRWFVGQFGENVVTAVFENYADRELLREATASICRSIAEPVTLGSATFTLTPCAGIALLGQDAKDPRSLLEHARSAMMESRRTRGRDVHFYSDTLRLRPIARLDLERELREAVAQSQVRLRYLPRYCLRSGRLESIHTYMRWPHPLRGEVRPAEFLPLAENTGLADALSRLALSQLRTDLGGLRADAGSDVAINFGALRHHLASDALARDASDFMRQSGAGFRFELRISERTLGSLANPERTLQKLASIGARIIVDEFGRDFNSLALLTRLPLAALQLDRAIVVASAHDPAAARICRAAVGIARALGLATYAPGVDSESDQQRLLDMGIDQGLGDFYREISAAPQPVAARA